MTYNSKMNSYLGMRFYNNSLVEVTESIKIGKTRIFKEEKHAEAVEYARERRSYTYELRVRKTNKSKIESYGYAVPN